MVETSISILSLALEGISVNGMALGVVGILRAYSMDDSNWSKPKKGQEFGGGSKKQRDN